MKIQKYQLCTEIALNFVYHYLILCDNIYRKHYSIDNRKGQSHIHMSMIT